MSQLLSSVDAYEVSSNFKRLKRFCCGCDKKICCTLITLMLFNAVNFFLLYFYNAKTTDVNVIVRSASAPLPLDTIHSFAHESFSWLNDPKLQQDAITPDPSGETPGSGGDYTITPDDLTLSPPAFRDFWSRTFYSPTLVKHDASALLRSVPYETECTVALDFEVTPKTQFDQAGLMVYIDDDHWVKAGIEYCDGSARLSVVVTNVFSDWSTQPWPSTAARLRLHKINKGSSIVIEACELGSEDFVFIRIAHLSSLAVHRDSPRYQLGSSSTSSSSSSSSERTHDEGAGADWRIGPYAASPMAQKGCVARFSGLEFGPRKESVHSADVSEMVATDK